MIWVLRFAEHPALREPAPRCASRRPPGRASLTAATKGGRGHVVAFVTPL
jgi:hypothetical protein